MHILNDLSLEGLFKSNGSEMISLTMELRTGLKRWDSRRRAETGSVASLH